MIPYTSTIFNKIIKERGYTHYLEIGISSGNTFRGVVCDVKDGVDPNQTDPTTESYKFVSYPYKSDIFFEKYIEKTYDIVFIDGLHHFDQVLRDTYNSLKFLNKGGIVFLHDSKPHTELMQRNPQPKECEIDSVWTGDVWKAIAKFRSVETKYICQTINFDLGLSMIEEGEATPISIPSDEELTYQYYLDNQEYILNFVSPKGYLIDEYIGPVS